MKTVLKVVGLLLLALLLLTGAGYGWAAARTHRMLARSFRIQDESFAIPFPLDSAEVVLLRLTPEQAGDSARVRAVRRGRHLVEARYGCTDCHGTDFGGGVMVDNAALGRILGPNLTTGQGSRTLRYGPADWDRMVRHGVKPDGRPGAMPSEDFQYMSDQELSDVVAYIRSLPPVDRAVPAVSLGPLGTVLVATGKMPLSADRIPDTGSHPRVPPPTEATAAFGEHLAATCRGCHGSDFAGGPIPGGDPSWPPARDITPAGLAGWSYQDFLRAIREGKRPDGTDLRDPMARMLPYGRNMTDVEARALWAYLQSLPAASRTD